MTRRCSSRCPGAVRCCEFQGNQPPERPQRRQPRTSEYGLVIRTASFNVDRGKPEETAPLSAWFDRRFAPTHRGPGVPCRAREHAELRKIGVVGRLDVTTSTLRHGARPTKDDGTRGKRPILGFQVRVVQILLLPRGIAEAHAAHPSVTAFAGSPWCKVKAVEEVSFVNENSRSCCPIHECYRFAISYRF